MMESFCGSAFWDWNLTWYTNEPVFTSCFESTVPVWIPCAFLWLFFGLDIHLSNQDLEPAGSISWNPFNSSKLCLLGLLSSMEITCLTLELITSDLWPIYPVTVVTPAVKLITFLLVGILQVTGRKRGVTTSGVQFFFWLFFAIGESFKFASVIRKGYPGYLEVSGFDQFLYTAQLTYYVLVLLEFILHFWADKAPSDGYITLSRATCPVRRASFPSQLFFSWFSGLIWRGFCQPLQLKDLWLPNPEDEPRHLSETFQKHWENSRRKRRNEIRRASTSKQDLRSVSKQGMKTKVSIFPAVVKTLWKLYFISTIIRVVPDTLAFVAPQIIRLVIKFVHGNEEVWKGYLYAIVLFVCAAIQAIGLNQSINGVQLTAVRIRTLLLGAIYRKSLRLSKTSRTQFTTGEIINFMSVDVEKIVDLFPYINVTWIAPFQLIATTYFLWSVLGPSVLAGVAVLFLLVPINAMIVPKVRSLVIQQLKHKDQRVKRLTEIFNGIKVLKLYAWEPPFEDHVRQIRREEVSVLRQIAILNAISTFLDTCSPYFVTVATFAAYVLLDPSNVLDAEKTFVSLTLFNMMYEPLAWLPTGVSRYFQTVVSFKRIDEFMNAEEIDKDAVTHDGDEDDTVVIEDGSFSWDEKTQTLHDINLRVRAGALIAVVGSVGSGKSSLLNAMLGELTKLSGRVNIKGSVAYVSQQPWITNATLRDNVVFGKSYNSEKFSRVMEACALKPDLQVLPGGMHTEIGEKGINLSGGQRQRVALARSAYRNADVYLLDDPISAVDSFVGKHIFDNVIGPSGILRKSTRIVTTNNLGYLPHFDFILVMSNGRIKQVGTYEGLMSTSLSFAESIATYGESLGGFNKEEEDHEKDFVGNSFAGDYSFDTNRSVSFSGSRRKSIAKLIEVETAETKSVKWKVYWEYFGNAQWLLVVGTALFFTLHQVFGVFGNLVLSEWSSQATSTNGTAPAVNNKHYLGVFASFGLLQAISILVGSLFMYLATLKSAAAYHSKMLRRVLHAPMTFFDTTPMGRIVNRFSKDIDTLDNSLPLNLKWWAVAAFKTMATVFVVSYSTPFIIIGLIPVLILFFFVQKFYVSTSRQLKRLESVSRSPIYSHFAETISGVTTIRAYRDEQRFVRESESKVEQNQACQYAVSVASRWLGIRLEALAFTLIFMATLAAVLERESVSPGIVGLSLSYAMLVTFGLKVLTRYACEVENNIVAVERIEEYLHVPQEAPWTIPGGYPPENWPEEGTLEFQHYETRYRHGLQLALRDLTAFIKDGEKVGIVGRTGAGKSSLTLALFRILEASSGSVVIDGQDISKLGLHSVRKRLTIIPQDPVLFSGTLRFNLDPFSVYTDENLWRAIELSNLKEFISQLPDGLEYQLEEDGENLSVGQRQLICLARALLPKTKILILDEATAAIDVDTEEIIRRTIRAEFKNSTVITIAHRLNNILDSDRIIVIEAGHIVEFDTPQRLLCDRNSRFSAMVQEASSSTRNSSSNA